MNLDEKDQERIHIALEHGTNTFSQKDLDDVLKKGDEVLQKGSQLGSVFGDLKILWSMLADYKNKKYTHIPWKFIAAVGFAVLYLLNPFDVIPDMIPIFGLLDDASVIGLVLSTFQKEFTAYKAWKQENNSTDQPL